MNTSPASKVQILRDRALLFERARAFFKARGVLEVDCPALSYAAPIDEHIDVMKVCFSKGTIGYLHTSPEYGMKQLLSYGMGDIYQISHVFREEENGPLHSPEFTMAEWYRIGFAFEEMIGEALDFIRLFLGDLGAVSCTYQELFLAHLGVDPFEVDADALYALAMEKGIGLSKEARCSLDAEALQQLLLSHCIEPHLGQGHLHVITHYPASQAALAKTAGNRALRFEVYYRGIELANGYEELTDFEEQTRRLHEAQALRLQAGKEALKIDQDFLNALKRGIPDCCGVAVGFDRLMQLRHGCERLEGVLALSLTPAVC